MALSFMKALQLAKLSASLAKGSSVGMHLKVFIPKTSNTRRASSPIAHLRPALDIPYCHHEKWDGTGYPRGLKGEAIPLAARIFAVVDVWDALRSDRPYRAAWPEDKVREYIGDPAGKHFDPQIAKGFLDLQGV